MDRFIHFFNCSGFQLVDFFNSGAEECFYHRTMDLLGSWFSDNQLDDVNHGQVPSVFI